MVAEVFSAAGFGDSAEIVLRPGCYLTHDVGSYRKAQQRILDNNPIAHHMTSGLIPALHVWAYVQSIPEAKRRSSGWAGAMRHSIPGFPCLRCIIGPAASAPQTAPAHWETTKLMDQHAYLKIAAGDDIQVGDMIGFDICHPCLTFDKWRALPIVDAEFNVIEVIQTFF